TNAVYKESDFPITLNDTLDRRSISLKAVLDFTCSLSDGGYGTTASPLSSQTGTSTNPYLLNYYGNDTNKRNQIELEISDNKCADSALTIESAQTAIVNATFDITHTGNKFLIKIKPTLVESSVFTSDTIKLTITDPTTGAKKDIHVLLKKNLPTVTMKTGSQINTILKNNLGANTTPAASTFGASTTPPPPGVTTYELSAADSEGQCLAWLDGTSIKYYAQGYTDASPVRKIPLNADSVSMFDNCHGLTSIDVSGFDTSSVTSMSNMFFACSNLTDITGLSGFDTSSVTNMYSMFNYCSSLISLDVSNFDTGSVTNMGCMFWECSSLTILDVSGFDTSRVTNMGGMFSYCSGLTSLDVSNFNTSSVTNMYYMFNGCSGLTSLDVSGFVTSGVTDMSYMFCACSGLTSLDVSGFVTSGVTDMSYMFRNCSGLTNLDVSGFNTGRVTDMGSMFSGCSGLDRLDVSGFNTSRVTDMNAMFKNCSSLTILDVSNFNTSTVTDMGYMFDYCSNLITIFASDAFDTTGLTDTFSSSYMFRDCTLLVGGNGTAYSGSYTNKTRARIDGGASSPGYFTAAP
ncbi:MAG: BspA family leucine-rich repeat surface protein, partial [Ruminococcus sp.]|nr:BspA family leucine-rich repeat surface protein [Ruminococcus sp.]